MKKISDLPELPINLADLVPVFFVDGLPRKANTQRLSLILWKPASEKPTHQGACLAVMNDGSVVAARYFGGPEWYNGHHCWAPLDDCGGEECFTESDFICWADLPEAPAFALPIIKRISGQESLNESHTSSEL